MEYITVAKLNKTFGTKGQIRIVADKAFKSDLEKCDVWFVEVAGNLIPYFVENLDESVHFLVKFEDIDSPESARKITGSIIKLRKKDVTFSGEVEGNDLDKLVGFTIKSQNDEVLGMIQSIEEYPQQLMAIIKNEDGYQILIPLASEFMVGMSVEDSIIVMQLPDGIVESQIG